MECPERERLWAQYELALDALCDVVDDVSHSSAAALRSKIIAAKAARDRCVRARKLWEDHLRDHSCDENRKYATA